MADAGCDVTVWGRDEKVCRQIAGEHRAGVVRRGDAGR